MQGSEPNPYAAPTAPLEREVGPGGGPPLAGRGARLVATLVDLALVPGLPGVAAGIAVPLSLRRSASPSGALVIAAAIGIAITAYQWYLVATVGQTIGKRMLGLRIVRLDGGPIGFVNGVVLRTWVLGVLAVIPFVGTVLSLADAVMIFGADRRCLHDYLAGSRVVRAE